MTKMITIPLSKEKCDKIKYFMGMSLWILATIGLAITFLSQWFDWSGVGSDGYRMSIGFFSGMGLCVSVGFMIWFLHEKGFWVSFQCSCERSEKNG